jgi:hypothetical protein
MSKSIKHKKALIVSIMSFTIISCNHLEKQLQDGWTIDQAYYNDEPVIWNLYNNYLGLNRDYTCSLPRINIDAAAEDIGKWKYFQQNDKLYLQISTENWIFNRTFEIRDLRKVGDPRMGYLMKMTLISDSLKLDCTKPLYE